MLARVERADVPRVPFDPRDHAASAQIGRSGTRRQEHEVPSSRDSSTALRRAKKNHPRHGYGLSIVNGDVPATAESEPSVNQPVIAPSTRTQLPLLE